MEYEWGFERVLSGRIAAYSRLHLLWQAQYPQQPSRDEPVCSDKFVVASSFVPLGGYVHIAARLLTTFCLSQATPTI